MNDKERIKKLIECIEGLRTVWPHTLPSDSKQRELIASEWTKANETIDECLTSIKIDEFVEPVRTVITKRDSEYRVRLFINGAHQKAADYFTNDKEDAEATAEMMKKHALKDMQARAGEI